MNTSIEPGKAGHLNQLSDLEQNGMQLVDIQGTGATPHASLTGDSKSEPALSMASSTPNPVADGTGAGNRTLWQDEQRGEAFDEHDEMCRQAMEALGYSGEDYDQHYGKNGYARADSDLDYGNDEHGHFFDITGHRNWVYRLAYVVLNLILAAALFSCPSLAYSSGDLAWFIVLIALCWASYFALQGSDPGYINPPEDATAEHLESAEADDTRLICGDDGMLTSKQFPPLRCIYCKAVKRYVAKFDHFCAFLGTPIGERNHFNFWVFLLLQSATLSQAIAIAHTGFSFSQEHRSNQLAAFSMFFLLMIVFLIIGGLFVFHTFLLVVGGTTYEILAHSRIYYMAGTDPADFPFSRSVAWNIKNAFWVQGVALLWTRWTPHEWRRPSAPAHERSDWWNSPWQNRYWSCF